MQRTISNLGGYIADRQQTREELEQATKEFLASGKKIEVLTSFKGVQLSVPKAAPKQIKAPRKIDKRRVRLDKTTTEWKYSTVTKSAILDNVRFGKLVALYDTGRRANDRQKLWQCVCDCGNNCEVATSQLTRRRRTDCGKCDEPKIKTMGEVVKRNKEREGVTA
jgi:hypothetical protein